jgi:hypothetical protein
MRSDHEPGEEGGGGVASRQSDLAFYRTARLIATIIFVAEHGGHAVYSIVFQVPDS